MHFSKLLFTLALAALPFASTYANDSETYSMVNLQSGDCQVVAEDTDANVKLDLYLEQVTEKQHVGYIGRKYISVRRQNPDVYSEVKVFEGANGDSQIFVNVEFKDMDDAANMRTKKDGSFLMILNNYQRPKQFQEMVLYEAWDNTTNKSIKGKRDHLNEYRFKPVQQDIEITNDSISFTRITDIGLTVSVSCPLRLLQ